MTWVLIWLLDFFVLLQGVSLLNQIQKQPENLPKYEIIYAPWFLRRCEVRPLLSVQLDHFAQTSVRQPHRENPWIGLEVLGLPEEVGALIRGRDKLHLASTTLRSIV